MATKQFLTLEGLTTYDGLIKEYIGTEDAKSIKSISVSGNTVSFFKTADGSGTAAYTVNLPDVSGFMAKIANATGGKVVMSNSDGSVSEGLGIASGDTMGIVTGYFPDDTSPGNIPIFNTFSDSSAETIVASEVNIDDVMLKIADASGDKVLVSDANGNASESSLAIGASYGAEGFVTGYFAEPVEDGKLVVLNSPEGGYDLVSTGVNLSDIATTTDLADKINKIASATGGKIATTTATGEVAESNTSISDLTTAIGGKVAKIANATGGKIATTTASGEVAESGTAIADLATKIDIANKMDKIADTEGGVVLISDANGNAVESNYSITHEDGILTGYLTGGGVLTYDPNVGDGSRSVTTRAIATDQSSGFVIGNYSSASDGSIMIYNHDSDEPFISASNVSADNIMTKIDSASGDKLVVSTSGGGVSESTTSISDITGAIDGKMNKISNADGNCVLMSNANGEAVESFGRAIQTEDAGQGFITGYYLDNATEGDIMTYLNNCITTSGVNISDLATNAYIGTIPQGSSATDVIGYIDEVAGDVGDEMEVTLVEAQTPTTGYLKTYELYQGGNAAANLVGKIDIPKDLVVTSGEIVVNPTGQPAGTYLKLTIANQTAPVYINVADLCDVYTAASGAAQVQLAISATNEISATLVAGGVGTTELAANAVTTAKIADDAVTADKVAISAHTEAQTAGADGLAISVTSTDGQVSAVSGSIAANTYDAYGAASTVQSTVIGTAGDAASANTINGAKAYADAATAAIATADIQALFA